MTGIRGTRTKIAAVVVAAGLGVGAVVLSTRDEPGAALQASAPSDGNRRDDLVRRYSQTGAQRRSVQSVQVKRTTWGEFAATANLAAEFTAAAGGLPDPLTEVYVILVRGEMAPAPGYPDVPGRPAYNYMVHVIDAATDKALYDESKPGLEQPPYFPALVDRPEPR